MERNRMVKVIITKWQKSSGFETKLDGKIVELPNSICLGEHGQVSNRKIENILETRGLLPELPADERYRLRLI